MTPEELGRQLRSCTSSAFRLECLPSYDVTEDAERDAYAAWLAGKELPSPHRDWPELVASAVAAGKRMQRVRVVRQMTQYIRFQIEWGYPANVAAGEAIYILDHEPPGLLRVDFWLFDDATAVVLEYDEHGRFTGLAPAETVEPYRQARDMALQSSVPFHEYRASLAT
jgi:hypothetical protein